MAAECMTLAAVHQRTVAVELILLGQKQLLKGRGVYDRDPDLGNVLRIQFPADTDFEIVLAEGNWDGDIASGETLGCDFLIRLR
jgi:hypothetical protein